MHVTRLTLITFLVLAAASNLHARTRHVLNGCFRTGWDVRLEYTGVGSDARPYVVVHRQGDVDQLYLEVRKTSYDVNDPDTQMFYAGGAGRYMELEVTFADQGRRVVSATLRPDDDLRTWPIDLYPQTVVSDVLVGAVGSDTVIVSNWASQKGGLETRVTTHGLGAIRWNSYVTEVTRPNPKLSRYPFEQDDGTTFDVEIDRSGAPKATLIGSDGTRRTIQILELGPDA